MSFSWEVRLGKDGIYYLEKRIAVPTLLCDLNCSWAKFWKDWRAQISLVCFLFLDEDLFYTNVFLFLTNFSTIFHTLTYVFITLLKAPGIFAELPLSPEFWSSLLFDLSFSVRCYFSSSTPMFYPAPLPWVLSLTLSCLLNILAPLSAQFNINEHLLLSKLDAPSCRSAHSQTEPSSGIGCSLSNRQIIEKSE